MLFCETTKSFDKILCAERLLGDSDAQQCNSVTVTFGWRGDVTPL